MPDQTIEVETTVETADEQLRVILNQRVLMLEAAGRELTALGLPAFEENPSALAPSVAMLRRLEKVIGEPAVETSTSRLQELRNQLRENLAYETDYLISGWVRTSPEYQELMHLKSGDRASMKKFGAVAQLGNITHRLVGERPEAFFPVLDGELNKAALPKDLTQKIRTEAQRLASALYPDWRPAPAPMPPVNSPDQGVV